MMNELDWIDEDLDERLHGLFSEDAGTQRATVIELIERCGHESDLEEAMLDTLVVSLQEGGDASLGTMWLITILGEALTESAVTVLDLGLASEDELIVAAAVRTLRRMGEPAFHHILERLHEDAFSGDVFAAAVQVLEGIALHDLPATRVRIEDHLISYLKRATPQREDSLRAESAALSLAHLGTKRARADIEHVHNQVFRRSNSFLQEALDLLDEHPDGSPCSSSRSWEDEFRWVWDLAPGGEIAHAGDDD